VQPLGADTLQGRAGQGRASTQGLNARPRGQASRTNAGKTSRGLPGRASGEEDQTVRVDVLQRLAGSARLPTTGPSRPALLLLRHHQSLLPSRPPLSPSLPSLPSLVTRAARRCFQRPEKKILSTTSGALLLRLFFFRPTPSLPRSCTVHHGRHPAAEEEAASGRGAS